MAITQVIKSINTESISCGGTLTVTLGLTAVPDILNDPADIVLVLDISGSMGTSGALAHMKAGACSFVDMLCDASGGVHGETIGGESRVGIVSFSSTATANTYLTQNAAELKNMINSFSALGSTNHAAAFSKAQEMFDPLSSNRKIILMFTDGETSAGPDPDPVAQAAKTSGTAIFCIGLGLPENILDTWASDPDSTHVMWTDDVLDVEELFTNLGLYVMGAGVVNGVIDEVINPDFRIIDVHTPTSGIVSMSTENHLIWEMPFLGAAAEETATLDFEIEHIFTSGGGQKEVNKSISFADDLGTAVRFPSPAVYVNCDTVIVPEPCPTPVDFTLDGCQDSAVIDLDDVQLLSLGRIVQLNVTVKNVCPNKRVALAVILTEVDSNGNEYDRGIKTVTIPAHGGRGCKDICVRCLRFVLPEDLDVLGSPDSLCNARRFKARAMANYLDTDFVCCDKQTPAP